MDINSYTPKLDYLLIDISCYKLYEVNEMIGAEGKITFRIKRIKVNKDDTLEKIHSIIQKLEEGKIWIKTGKRSVGDFKYSGKGLAALTREDSPIKIEKIIIERSVQNDKISEDSNIEITEDFNVEEIDESRESKIKSILEDIEEVQRAKLPIEKPAPAGTRSLQLSKNREKEVATTKSEKSPQARSVKESRKAVEKNLKKVIETTRKEKRRAIEEAEKKEEEAKDIRREAQKFDDTKREIRTYENKQKEIKGDSASAA